MNSRRYFLTPISLCHSSIVVSFPRISPAVVGGGDDAVGNRNRSTNIPHSNSFLIRIAMRISRARWFSFLRRVFHYQNGHSSTSDLGSNPLNSITWMMMECISLSIQIIVSVYTLAVSKEEKPVWPMRIWALGYVFGCILSVVLLYSRYWAFYIRPQRHDSDTEQQIRSHDDHQSRESSLHAMMEKLRTSLELFFAIWFVMGNVWVFESRLLSYHHAPKLHLLCISLLSWNAVTYSFPFLVFLLLCCCVPMLSTFLGYNMNMASVHRGASDEQLSSLPSWKYKLQIGNKEDLTNSDLQNDNSECCICLAKYGDKEDIRQLPCSHIFHLNCVDQWLRIISCCPLCKQELER